MVCLLITFNEQVAKVNRWVERGRGIGKGQVMGNCHKFLNSELRGNRELERGEYIYIYIAYLHATF